MITIGVFLFESSSDVGNFHGHYITHHNDNLRMIQYLKWEMNSKGVTP